MPMTEHEKEQVLAHWNKKTAEGVVPIYSTDAEEIGLPNLGTMSVLSKQLKAEVCHYGFGVFGAKRSGKEVFSFCGGGAMETLFDGDTDRRVTSFSAFSGEDEAYLALKDASPEAAKPGIQTAIDFIKTCRARMD